MTIWIITNVILVLSETVLSNLHTLQFTQSSDVHSRHIIQAVVSNLQLSQSRESGQIQFSEGQVTNTIVNDNLRHRGVKNYQFIDASNSRIRIVSGQIRMVS